MRRVPHHHLLEVADRLLISLLRACNATELVMRVDLLVIDGYRFFEPLAGRIQFPALLINKAEVVMRGSIGGIQRRGLKILFECSPRSLLPNDLVEISAQEQKQHDYQERR